MSNSPSEKPDRQALLLRARKRIEEKRLFQQVLLESKNGKDAINLTDSLNNSRDSLVPRTIPISPDLEIHSIPLPAARYRRVSLNLSARNVPFISRPRSSLGENESLIPLERITNSLRPTNQGIQDSSNAQNISNGMNQTVAQSPDTRAIWNPGVTVQINPEINNEANQTRNNLGVNNAGDLNGRMPLPSPLTIRAESSNNSSRSSFANNVQPIPIPRSPEQIPLTKPIDDDNPESPTIRTNFFDLSKRSLINPMEKKLEKMLEKGVTMTPINVVDIEYTGLSVIPTVPRIETNQEKKRKSILMKRGKRVPMPDDSPLKQEDVQEIVELEELYSSNSSLTFRAKWNSHQDALLDFTFTYPAPFSQSITILRDQISPLDGFYVPDTPIIASWNYDRLLRRLHATEPHGPWFSGNFTLSIFPDPVNHIHYRPLSIDNQGWSNVWDQEAALVRLPAQKSNHQEFLSPSSLIVDLSGLTILSHPLMIEEHILARTLEELVKTVQTRIKTHLVPFLFQKVISLQETFEELKAEFGVLKKAKIDDIAATPASALTSTAMKPKLRLKNTAEQKLKSKILETRDAMVRILKEILAARQLRDTESQMSRLLEYRIIKTWDQIKGVRIAQGFSSTSIKLYIRSSLAEKVDYKKEADLEVYFKKELWELERIDMAGDKVSFQGYMVQDQSTEDTDHLLKHKVKSSKYVGNSVEHLEVFQEKKVKENAIRRLKACYPSQPQLDFRIEFCHKITNNPDCPHTEQMRRHAAEASRYYLVLYYNGNLVTKTNPKELDSKFGINFTDLSDLSQLEGLSAQSGRASFILSVTDIPRNFKVHVYEVGILGDTFVCEVYIPLPPFGDMASSLDRRANSIDFTGTHSPIEGKLHISLSWGENPRLENRIVDQLPTDPLSFHGPAGLLNLSAMIEWILQTNFDPNDPRNADLMKIRELIYSVAGHDTFSLSRWNSQGFFRVGLPVWLSRMTLGVGPEYLDDYQPRFKTLIGRFRKELLYSGPVPLSVEEFNSLPPVNPHMLRDETEASVLKSWDTRFAIREGYEPKFVDLGFLKRIRSLQLIRKNALKIPRHLDDFVTEARIDFQADIQFDIMRFFRPFRPLNPYRTNRQKIVTKDAERCKLVIQLVAGLNLPLRNNARGSKLKPFVELSFQKRKTRSNTSEGGNPQWNQTLAIDIEAPDGDFRPEALMETDIASDYIVINVFDEITIDLLQDERQRDKEMYIRKEKVYLGSIEIPFTSVWERTRIDGKFPINIPPSLLGYGQDTTSDESIKIDAQDHAQLHIFITLDPPLAQPPALKLKFQTDEPADIIKAGLKFQDAATAIQKPTVVITNDMQGKSTLICRYIRPQNPPPMLKDASQLGRFVASIPFLPNRTVFAVTCNLWSTSDQILNVGAADSIEHAILLCNYMLALDYEARVILGSTLVDGNTAFVVFQNKEGKEGLARNSSSGARTGTLSKFIGNFANLGWPNDSNLEENFKYSVCDPVTGTIYNATDRKCPLQDITSVFDDKNIWINLQQEKRLDKTSLNLSNTSLWRQFNPNSTVFSILPSIQPAILEYKDPSIKWIADLEQAIERLLISKFEEWRKGNVTRWNRLCSRSFKTLIARFEDDLIAGVDLAASIQDSSEINSISRVYKLSGHPISMPYTDGMAICNAIQSRGIHENVQSGVEFAIAVHCIGYPGRFVNVHVFLASLVRS